MLFRSDAVLPAGLLINLAAHSVGPSFASYSARGHLWALPLDAAAQIATVRENLLDRTPAPPPPSQVAVAAQRDRGAGRPTKRERRAIDRLRGRG